MSDDKEPEFLDRVIGNPAFEQMGGYHIFFRRAAIPILLFVIGLFTYTVLANFLSHGTNLVASFAVVGLSIGPILNLERYYGTVRSK
jgi:hypothetical protein